MPRCRLRRDDQQLQARQTPAGSWRIGAAVAAGELVARGKGLAFGDLAPDGTWQVLQHQADRCKHPRAVDNRATFG